MSQNNGKLPLRPGQFAQYTAAEGYYGLATNNAAAAGEYNSGNLRVSGSNVLSVDRSMLSSVDDAVLSSSFGLQQLGLEDGGAMVGELDFPRQAGAKNGRLPAYYNGNFNGNRDGGVPSGGPSILQNMGCTNANSAPANVQTGLPPAFQQHARPATAHRDVAGEDYFSSGSNSQYPSMSLLPLALQAALNNTPQQFGLMTSVGMPSPLGTVTKIGDTGNYEATSMASCSHERPTFNRSASLGSHNSFNRSTSFDRHRSFNRSMSMSDRNSSFGHDRHSHDRSDRSSSDRLVSTPDNAPRAQEYRQLWDQVWRRRSAASNQLYQLSISPSPMWLGFMLWLLQCGQGERQAWWQNPFKCLLRQPSQGFSAVEPQWRDRRSLPTARSMCRGDFLSHIILLASEQLCLSHNRCDNKPCTS